MGLMAGRARGPADARALGAGGGRRMTAGAIDPVGAGELPPSFRELAKRPGEPQIPGLKIVYLHPLGDPADANKWRYIIVHQTEGPPGSARSLALAQSKNPTKRGVTVWVETDGTVYWSTAETAIPTHGDGANRNDNKYVDNSKTYRTVIKTNSLGVEFVGNFPDVAKPATRGAGAGLVDPGPLPAGALRHRRPRISMRTTGSTIRITAIARAASWRRLRASSPTGRERPPRRISACPGKVGTGFPKRTCASKDAKA